MVPILQLMRRGVVARHPQEAATALAGEFRARRCATVPALIEPSLPGRFRRRSRASLSSGRTA